MNYLKILKCDIANSCGFGWGVTVFVSGCSHNCPGCFSPQTHDPNAGVQFDDDAKSKLLRALAEPLCDCLTWLGGDPLYKDNRATVIRLSKEIREKYSGLKQVLYTGYTIEEIWDDDTMRPILYSVDVIVDGRFEIAKKDMSLPYRGSANQRVICVKDWLLDKCKDGFQNCV